MGLICDAGADDANPIESSVVDRGKITAAMTRVMWEHEFGRGLTEVFFYREMSTQDFKAKYVAFRERAIIMMRAAAQKTQSGKHRDSPLDGKPMR